MRPLFEPEFSEPEHFSYIFPEPPMQYRGALWDLAELHQPLRAVLTRPAKRPNLNAALANSSKLGRDSLIKRIDRRTLLRGGIGGWWDWEWPTESVKSRVIIA